MGAIETYCIESYSEHIHFGAYCQFIKPPEAKILKWNIFNCGRMQFCPLCNVQHSQSYLQVTNTAGGENCEKKGFKMCQK